MKILLATDGSVGALDAAHFLALLDHSRETHVHVLTIQNDGANNSNGAEAADSILASARKALGGFPGHVTSSSTETRCTTSGIVERIQVAAEMLPADLVVTGSRGNSPVVRFFLGSVALGVARHSPCSVLVGRSPDGPLTRIVAGIDDSDDSGGVIQFLSRLPIPRSCAIHLVHVALPDEVATNSGAMLPAALRQEISATIHQSHVNGPQRLDNAATVLRSCGWSVTTEMHFGDPATELLEVANGNIEKGEYRADLVVIGARRQSVVEKYFLGSVSSGVIEQARCSVLVVRP